MDRADRRWLLRGTVVALALVVGFVAWLSEDDDGGEASPPPAAEVRILTAEELRGLAEGAGHPVYWAGEMPGTALEVTESADGSVQVRYLPEGDGAQTAATTLTVGTYPLDDPEAALDVFAEQEGATVRSSPDGRGLYTSAQQPTSVYFASPDNSVQVEVYDPSPRRASALAASRVQPVR